MNQDLTYNQRNALMFTIEEKEVLHSLIEWTEQVLELLMMEPSEAIQAIQAEEMKFNGEYFSRQLLPLLQKEK